MRNSTIAWVPVLAPLLSIVADQESPDMVLNDFLAVGFNFHLPQELDGAGANATACMVYMCARDTSESATTR
jgi:hypothetical protein